jgi:hypothetical protein
MPQRAQVVVLGLDDVLRFLERSASESFRLADVVFRDASLDARRLLLQFGDVLLQSLGRLLVPGNDSCLSNSGRGASPANPQRGACPPYRSQGSV